MRLCREHPEATGRLDPFRLASFEAEERRFWTGFQDPLLAQLIEQALDANQDLRAALGTAETDCWHWEQVLAMEQHCARVALRLCP